MEVADERKRLVPGSCLYLYFAALDAVGEEQRRGGGGEANHST